MLLSKSLQLSDYNELQEETQAIQLTDSLFRGKLNFPHPHRFWEYASAIKAGEYLTQVLDVGAGYGALGPTLATQLGANVTELELTQKIVDARKALQIPNLQARVCPILDFEPEPIYDSVYCISVLEHIAEWSQALQKLMDSTRRGGLLFLTVDYGQPGAWQNDSDRQSKFTDAEIHKLASQLIQGGFELMVDYEYHGPQVFDYTFFRIAAYKQ